MSLPEELKDMNHWVVWNVSKNRPKTPFDPRTMKPAEADNPATWASYQEAVNAAQGKGYGLGLEFGEPGGIAGIDIDHCINADGKLSDMAAKIVQIMDSYTEVSPSGTGIHILFTLTEPLSNIGSRRKNDKLGLEMYDTGRYFTVTGKPYGEQLSIAERTEAVRKVYALYMADPEKQTASRPVDTSTLDDRDLWEHMFNSRNGRELYSLYIGDISGHESPSQADLALCNHLAYWTGNNASRIDNMFRQSALYRPKWDERHGAQTYGDMTINKAIAGTPDYIGSIPRPESKRIAPSPKTEAEAPTPDIVFISDYLDKSLEGDIGRYQRYSKRKTGYSNIDEKTSLYNGLYVVGAVSSLGKTTFSTQMADQLAQAGEHVLYFALEQSRMELVTKGLARLTAQEWLSKYGNEALTKYAITDAMTALEIRSGRITDAVRRAIAEYKKFASHEAIIECDFRTTADAIIQAVEAYIRRTGIKPVVFIDYLQLLRPQDTHKTTKDAVDEHLRALKQMQMTNDLVVILISSLNRQNYLSVLDFESFKETGGIEYTADVIWGLQLQVMNSEIFDKEKGLKAKRETVREAKRATPRRIEFCCLKNRYGVANYSCFFEYHAKYDLFIPVEVEEDKSSYAEALESAPRKIL